jgi:hypothetical protein
LNELFAIDLAFVLQAITKKEPPNQHQNLTASTHRSNQSNETKSKSTKPDAESIEKQSGRLRESPDFAGLERGFPMRRRRQGDGAAGWGKSGGLGLVK